MAPPAAGGTSLTWLDRTGQLAPGEAPADRVDPARLASYVEAMRSRGNAVQSVLTRLQQLDRFLGAIAPGQDRTPLRRLMARLRAAPRDTNAKRARLRFSGELLALGRRLMAEAEGGELTPKQQATGYRDGLMIALLAARPLRRKNFTRIEVGRHLVREGASWQLRIAGEETKTGRPIAQPFPAVLVPSLERYLAVHRPVLAALPGHRHRPAGAALWLSARGTPMAEITLYFRITQLTRAAFGQAIHPHLFRDAAATSLAILDPAQVRIAAQILGHASPATSERHYNLARSLDAGKAWHETLDQLRREEAVDGCRSAGRSQRHGTPGIQQGRSGSATIRRDLENQSSMLKEYGQMAPSTNPAPPSRARGGCLDDAIISLMPNQMVSTEAPTGVGRRC